MREAAHAQLRHHRFAVGREEQGRAALVAGTPLELAAVRPDGRAVGRRGMVGVGHVVHLQLPVAAKVVAMTAGGELDPAFGRAVHQFVDALARLAQEIEQRHHARVERGEHEAAIAVDARQRLHARARLAQRFLGEVGPHGHARQLAIGAECPAVIHAREHARVAARARQHLGAAVAAAVVQHVHRTALVAAQHHRLAGQRRAVIVARVGHQAVVAHVDPHLAEYLGHLGLEHGRIGVIGPVHAIRLDQAGELLFAVRHRVSC